MRKLLIALAILLALIVAAVVLLPVLVPKEALVARLQQAVEQQTGRSLQVNGPVDVSVFPTLGLSLEQVRLAGTDGGPDLLAVDQMDVALQLWPLLSGEARIDRFLLDRPVINLVVDKRGRGNWQFNPPTGQPGADPAPPAAGPEAGGGLNELVLGDVEIRDGRITYADRATGLTRTAEAVNLTAALPGLDDPLRLNGSLRLDGKPLDLTAQVAPARALIEGGTASLTTKASRAGTDLSLDGQLERPAQGAPAFVGKLALEAASLADLMQAVTGVRPEGLPIDNLQLTGQAKASPTRIALSALDLRAADITATGDVAVALGGVRPALSGKLAVSRLDLDRLLSQPAPTPAQPAPPAPAAPGVAGQSAGWSREPIDVSALRSADLDLDVALAGLLVAGVEAGATRLSLDLKDGRLAAVLADTPIFGGVIGGRTNLDGQGNALGLMVQASLNGVQAEPVLRRFAGFDRLTGTSEGAVDVRANGRSIYDLVSSLDGTGSLIFRNGAIRGVNIAQLVRSVTGGDTGGPQQTDFAEMGASFTLQKGTARSDDFRLLAPLLRVTGAGSVHLPERQVDFRIIPRLVASIEGQGAESTAGKGLSVPILVTGSFEALSFRPDLSNVVQQAIQDPNALKQQLKDLKSSPRGLLDALTGKAAPPSPPSGSE